MAFPAIHTNHFSHANSVGTTLATSAEITGGEKRLKKSVFDDLVTKINQVRATWNMGAVGNASVQGAAADDTTWTDSVTTGLNINKNNMIVHCPTYASETASVVNPTGSASGTYVGTVPPAATDKTTKFTDTGYAAALAAAGSKYCTSNSYSHSDHASHSSHDSHSDHANHLAHESYYEHTSHDSHGSYYDYYPDYYDNY